MKLLHTSDWHLGRMLCSKKERTDEHQKFLDWLLDTIKANSVDTLIVAGDIFDNSAPSNNTTKMYYDFLLRVRNSGCKNVIVTGGNHDSPGFLNAPKDILAALNVFVVGNASDSLEDEIIVLNDDNNEPIAVVCAVPFLRERDISSFAEGETYSDRSKRIEEGIKLHYAQIAEIAEQKRKESGKSLPIIATGHLSVFGGQRSDDDGVRDTYIGTIKMLNSNIFPQIFDYVALGHFHIASAINKNQNIRYCGSPIPMGFGEAKQQKVVVLVETECNCGESSNSLIIKEIHIPCFQKLETICGNKDFIFNRLIELKKSNKSVWVEIIDDTDIFPDLNAWAKELVINTQIEILKSQDRQYWDKELTKDNSTRSLEELDKFEVFDKLLEKNEISDEQKEELKTSYEEIVIELNIEN